jgi:flagellar assembly factor FliW
MSESSAALLHNPYAAFREEEPRTEAEQVIETRFGPLAFGPENRVNMPLGLLGFGNYRRFGLAELPQPELAAFRLLQSLENPKLSFIVHPVKLGDPRIAREDLEDAALSVGIDVESAAFLLIVTVRPGPKGSSITVNLRAPIVVDVKRALARQVVMANSSYSIQQPLQLGQQG